MKVYLGGCAGIDNPVDANGVEIKEGDRLSWDFHDDFYKDRNDSWMRKAVYRVDKHRSGKGLCGNGIHKPLYLHDFRFKYCEVVK